MTDKTFFKIIFSLLILACVALFAVFPASAADVNELDLDIDERAGAVYLYSYDSDRVLISHKSEDIVLPASTAKMMAGLLVCENYIDRLESSVVITEEMLEGHSGASMSLQVGMEVTVKTLLYGTVCGGNNDAAQALAIACAGSVQDFVNQMNVFAARLYMYDTHYKNPTGMDEKGARTTLADVAKLARWASKNNTYVGISSLSSFDFYSNGALVSTVYNRNALHSQFSAVGYVNKYATGLNAGSTDEGGYVVVTNAKKNDMSYLCIVMGASADNTNVYSYHTANQLLNRIFNNYSLKKIASAGEIFTELEVEHTLTEGKNVKLPCSLSSDISVVLGDDVDIKKDVTYKIYSHEKNIRAPIKEGDVIGGVNVYLKNVLIARGELVASCDIEANFILHTLDVLRTFIFGRVFLMGAFISVASILGYIYIDSKRSRYKKVSTVRFNKFS